MGTQTTNYSFHLPTVGGDGETWGLDFPAGGNPDTDPSPGLNGNWERMDRVMKDMQDRADALISSTGGSPLYETGFVNGVYFRQVGSTLECWGSAISLESVASMSYARAYASAPVVILSPRNGVLPPNAPPYNAMHVPQGAADLTSVHFRVIKGETTYVVPNVEVNFYSIGTAA